MKNETWLNRRQKKARRLMPHCGGAFNGENGDGHVDLGVLGESEG